MSNTDKVIRSNFRTFRKTISETIAAFNATGLIRIEGRNGNTDSIVIKEKKATNTADLTKIENVISVLQSKGFIYKGIGVGFDYNGNEYTMILSYSNLL